MKKENTFKLIDGTFSPSESKEVLQNIFSSKMQFHHMKNFSSQERFGKDDAIATKRIPQLAESLNHILKVIKEAEQNGEQLVIKSDVVIKVTKKKSSLKKSA